ncbi:hypothetical protein ACRRTK_016392 [Alexandromys fortis]
MTAKKLSKGSLPRPLRHREGYRASASVRYSDEWAPVLLLHISPITVTKSPERVLNAHHRAAGTVGWDLLTVETGSARDSRVGSLEDDLT